MAYCPRCTQGRAAPAAPSARCRGGVVGGGDARCARRRDTPADDVACAAAERRRTLGHAPTRRSCEHGQRVVVRLLLLLILFDPTPLTTERVIPSKCLHVAGGATAARGLVLKASRSKGSTFYV